MKTKVEKKFNCGIHFRLFGKTIYATMKWGAIENEATAGCLTSRGASFSPTGRVSLKSANFRSSAGKRGGWQWSAGTGADAAPYFRIQNPWSQTKRYDPKGEYIKRWVPELKDVAPKLLLDPPADNKPIAAGYPLPCVDHKTERERTLAIFKKHREQSGR